MKAAVCREFGKPLVIEDVELALPQIGEVQVKLAACAICHSDILYAEGAWGGRLPAVYGHEAAGVVKTIGIGLSGLSNPPRNAFQPRPTLYLHVFAERCRALHGA